MGVAVPQTFKYVPYIVRVLLAGFFALFFLFLHTDLNIPITESLYERMCTDTFALCVK
jgi:hypothetical protein